MRRTLPFNLQHLSIVSRFTSAGLEHFNPHVAGLDLHNEAEHFILVRSVQTVYTVCRAMLDTRTQPSLTAFKHAARYCEAF